MTSSTIIKERQSQKDPVTTYHEREIGKTLYRVTSVYTGKIELKKALEDLTVQKILAIVNTSAQYAS